MMTDFNSLTVAKLKLRLEKAGMTKKELRAMRKADCVKAMQKLSSGESTTEEVEKDPPVKRSSRRKSVRLQKKNLIAMMEDPEETTDENSSSIANSVFAMLDNGESTGQKLSTGYTPKPKKTAEEDDPANEDASALSMKDWNVDELVDEKPVIATKTHTKWKWDEKFEKAEVVQSVEPVCPPRVAIQRQDALNDEQEDAVDGKPEAVKQSDEEDEMHEIKERMEMPAEKVLAEVNRRKKNDGFFPAGSISTAVKSTKLVEAEPESAGYFA